MMLGVRWRPPQPQGAKPDTLTPLLRLFSGQQRAVPGSPNLCFYSLPSAHRSSVFPQKREWEQNLCNAHYSKRVYLLKIFLEKCSEAAP